MEKRNRKGQFTKDKRGPLPVKIREKLRLAAIKQHAEGRVRTRKAGEWKPTMEMITKMRKTKISQNLKGKKSTRWKGGKPKCKNCGKRLSNYGLIRCINCAHKKELNPAWKGGISFDPYPKEFNAELKLKIRTRDNFTCCLCKKTEREELEELNRVLCVNHINYNKQDCREENLNTLCLRCNTKVNKDREYWTDYFNQSYDK